MAAIAAAPSGVLVMIHCAPSAEVLFDQIHRMAPAASPSASTKASTERGVAVGVSSAERTAGQDLRNYGVGAQILRSLGVRRMRLLSRPRKMPSMAGYGLEVTGFQNES
jgi:3,4-dihydroxy 2-butanone 4-phosphate synthase/GTP cyclohydrolase II